MRSMCGQPVSTCCLLYSTCCLPVSTCSLLCSTCSLPVSTCSLLCSTCRLPVSTCGLLCSTCSLLLILAISCSTIISCSFFPPLNPLINRQRKPESATVPFFTSLAINANRSSMQMNNRFGNRKSEACTSACTSS